MGANVAAVPSGCGLFADSSQQWLSAFRQLAADPSLRLRFGLSARDWVEKHYSLRSALPVLSGVIQNVVAAHVC